MMTYDDLAAKNRAWMMRMSIAIAIPAREKKDD